MFFALTQCSAWKCTFKYLFSFYVSFNVISLTDRRCNPSLLSIIGYNTTTIPTQGQVVQWWDAQGIVGLILFLLCVLYSR